MSRSTGLQLPHVRPHCTPTLTEAQWLRMAGVRPGLSTTGNLGCISDMELPNPSLIASTVLTHAPPPGTTMFCHYCQEADHNPVDCALLSADPFLDLPRSRPYSTIMPRACSRPSPYDSSIEVSRRYNRGACPDSGTCKNRHIYSHQPGHTQARKG